MSLFWLDGGTRNWSTRASGLGALATDRAAAESDPLKMKVPLPIGMQLRKCDSTADTIVHYIYTYV